MNITSILALDNYILKKKGTGKFRVMVFKATFNSISVLQLCLYRGSSVEYMIIYVYYRQFFSYIIHTRLIEKGNLGQISCTD